MKKMHWGCKIEEEGQELPTETIKHSKSRYRGNSFRTENKQIQMKSSFMRGFNSDVL